MDQPGLVDRHQPGRGADRHRVQARARQRSLPPDGLDQGGPGDVLGDQVRDVGLDPRVQDPGRAERGDPPGHPRLRGEPVPDGRVRYPLLAEQGDDYLAVVDHLGHEHPRGAPVRPGPAVDPAGEPVVAHAPRIVGLQRHDVGHAGGLSRSGGTAGSGLAGDTVRTIRTFCWLTASIGGTSSTGKFPGIACR